MRASNEFNQWDVESLVFLAILPVMLSKPCPNLSICSLYNRTSEWLRKNNNSNNG